MRLAFHFDGPRPCSNSTTLCVVSQDCLSKLPFENAGVTQESFEQAWRQEHKLLLHQQQQELQIDQTKLFKCKPCWQLGLCVCGPAHRTKLQMMRALVTHLKGFFVNVNKKPSPQRVLLRSWKVVLRIREKGAESAGMYLHVGAGNFTTWELVCLQLREIHRGQDSLTLQVCGLQEASPMDVQTLLAFLVRHVDSRTPCSVACFQVLFDRRPVEYDQISPQFVEVAAQPLLEEQVFWKGDAAQRKRRQQRPAAQPSARRQRPAYAAPRQRRPMQDQPPGQPDADNDDDGVRVEGDDDAVQQDLMQDLEELLAHSGSEEDDEETLEPDEDSSKNP